MHRLHATLSSSPNPALLEMRILANHGADARFAFLRPGARGGRWRETWEQVRSGELKAEGEGEAEEPVVERENEKGGGMAGLAAYGSSDEDDEDDGAPRAEADIVEPEALAQPFEQKPDEGPSVEVDPAAEQERLRRQEQKAEKARAWAQKRREAREAHQDEV